MDQVEITSFVSWKIHNSFTLQWFCLKTPLKEQTGTALSKLARLYLPPKVNQPSHARHDWAKITQCWHFSKERCYCKCTPSNPLPGLHSSISLFFFFFSAFSQLLQSFHPILNLTNCFRPSIYFCRSHFHEVFIPKLLSTALKEYSASQSLGGISGEASVMTPTMVQVLAYLSLQHSQEIKSNLLTLFRVS